MIANILKTILIFTVLSISRYKAVTKKIFQGGGSKIFFKYIDTEHLSFLR